jgi:hypothetical protein
MQNAESLAYQISLTLGDHADDFDIPAIEKDLRAMGATNVDAVDTEAYWAIVERHDVSQEDGGDE